jgi:hypothetical protein
MGAFAVLNDGYDHNPPPPDVEEIVQRYAEDDWETLSRLEWIEERRKKAN